ncbi:MAG: H-X9-DG-CTERM domain-containing protein [Abditibacteriaceae bacterium]
MSNLKQIGIGMMMYTQDYDEKFPMYMHRDNEAAALVGAQNPPMTPAGKYEMSDCCVDDHYLSWMDEIYPYIKSLAVFDCPSRDFPFDDPYDSNNPHDYPSYAMNGIIGGNWDFSGSPPYYVHAASLASINGASQKILLLHNAYWPYAYLNPADFIGLSNQFLFPADAKQAKISFGMFPHLGGSNLLFADGHVKFTSAKQRDHWTCQDQSPAPNLAAFSNTVSDASQACGYWSPLVPPPS